jgi:hypothetical protein
VGKGPLEPCTTPDPERMQLTMPSPRPSGEPGTTGLTGVRTT